MNTPPDERRKRYFHISTQLARYSDNQLRDHLASLPHSTGWGRNQVIDVGGLKVFVKRIPITDREMADVRSTRNHFQLPIYYNYGVGSAGFGAFREMFTHIKTTNWVLDGAIENFPLMYDHRIVPRSDSSDDMSAARLARHVEYWASNADIGTFRQARSDATSEMLLFLEFFPATAAAWLKNNGENFVQFFEEMADVIHFLQANGVIHFDVQRNNILTDGRRMYLSDFGLALDLEFELTEPESSFFVANSHYDDGSLVYCLLSQLFSWYTDLTEPEMTAIRERYGSPSTQPAAVASALLSNVEDIASKGLMPLNRDFVGMVVAYRPAIEMFHDFSSRMRAGSRKDFVFPNAELKRLLGRSG
ncbi:MAG: protein kinase [Alphaproteobacteria bacterium]|nr:protein kinase [Alphaproteobacteria bacterium]